MTLHDAIIYVLDRAGKSLTAREIAKRINSVDLYRRKADDSPVPTKQIRARINGETYSHLFSKDKSTKPMLIGLAEKTVGH